jgi:hypothetical protein
MGLWLIVCWGEAKKRASIKLALLDYTGTIMGQALKPYALANSFFPVLGHVRQGRNTSLKPGGGLGYVFLDIITTITGAMFTLTKRRLCDR